KLEQQLSRTMKYCLLFLSMAVFSEFYFDQQAVIKQDLDICAATSIILPFDAADTQVKYWDGSTVRLDTLISYRDEYQLAVQQAIEAELLHYWVNINEEQEAELIPSALLTSGESLKEEDLHIQHTVYLPRSIKHVHWKSPIPVTESRG
ncbi:MAG: hypothetical protein AAF598_16520, partial [Bacteroidota bacterium]